VFLCRGFLTRFELFQLPCSSSSFFFLLFFFFFFLYLALSLSLSLPSLMCRSGWLCLPSTLFDKIVQRVMMQLPAQHLLGAHQQLFGAQGAMPPMFQVVHIFPLGPAGAGAGVAMGPLAAGGACGVQ
jgi:hypothetical protein